MSTVKKTKNGKFQLRVVSKLLPKDFYSTFESEEDAKKYGDQLEVLLAQNIVPESLLVNVKKNTQTSWLISRCIHEYKTTGSVVNSEEKILDTLRPSMTTVSTSELNYAWAENFVRKLKFENNLSSGTINKRVGALRRCFDWIINMHPEIIAVNVLAQLKRGYSTYTDSDIEILKKLGKKPKNAVERDRRLNDEIEFGEEKIEEDRILDVMKDMHHERNFFIVALETAMRMREIYTLDVSQISFKKRTISLDKTKNGDKRQVPMSTVIIPILKSYLDTYAGDIKARNGIIFPFWNESSTAKDLASTTSQTSRIFHDIFKDARVKDFRFHDIRHETTCRLFLRTKMDGILISKITGHKDARMLQRYASLRGSDLAEMMW
jgi:integrase